MALPPLVDASELQARLEPTVLPDGVLAAAVQDASTAVRAAVTETWVDDQGDLVEVPDVVALVTLQVARRLATNPDGLRSEQVGAYLAAYMFASPGAKLTRDELRLLSPWLRSRIASVQLGSPTLDVLDGGRVAVVDVDGSTGGDPMPWGLPA